MTPRLVRLAYALEFLVAMVAIFTAWSEIGGQAALDLMSWGWKLGLSVTLAGAIVWYTVGLVGDESVWNSRTARALSCILLVTLVMGAVTYYYFLQEDTGESDEGDAVSANLMPKPPVRQLT